jgi:hypothetical protein
MRGLRITKRKCALLVALCSAAVQALAQSPAPAFKFAYQVAGASAVAIGSGDTIQFPIAPVGSSSAVTLVVSSTYPSAWTVTRATTTGTGFATLGAGTPVPANSASSFLVSSTPPSVGTFTGGLSLTLANAAGDSASYSFVLSATGLSGVLMSYTLSSGNQTLLADGGVIPFPLTPINTPSNALFAITNRTAAPVTLNSVLISGAAFRTLGMPLLPLQIAAGQEIRFTVSFTPADTSPASGTLVVTIGGSASKFNLAGGGSGSVLSYEVGDGSSSSPLNPGDAVALGSADANSGQTRTTIRIRNSGNLAAQIAGISSSRLDFQLQDLPRFPATIAVGDSVAFTVVFAPRTAGPLTGTLTIGSATFQMTGTGLGSSFSVTLVIGDQRSQIAPGGSAILPTTAIGSRQPFTLEIANVGNQDGTITTLKLLGGGFALAKPPSLPITLAAGSSLQVDGVFAPTVTGIVNGSVFVQEQGYGLVVTANPPPPLPSLTFSNVSPQMSPLVQPGLGLSLASPYPYDLDGLLSISFASKGLGDDPSIQFVAGARFVPFQIKANSTRAVFGSSAQTAPFQTGSIAGVITLSVTLSVGTYQLTDPPIAYDIAIPAAAPVIYSVELLSESTNAVNLLVKGYSTTRSVQQVSLDLAPNVGAILQTTALRADVEKAFDTWFKTSAGQSFGSQFALTLQLNVTGAVSAIKSVNVSAANAAGNSTAVGLALN